MALFKASLRFATDNTWTRRVKWANTFFIEAANPSAAAAALVVGWATDLRNAVRTTVFAYEAYATSVIEGDEIYDVVNIPAGQQRGNLVPPSGEQYQMNTCISVTMRTIGGGRPSRKFWRPGLYEGDVVNGAAINPTLVNAVEVAFADFISTMGAALVDPDGQLFQGIALARMSQRKLGREAAENLPAPPVG